MLAVVMPPAELAVSAFALKAPPAEKSLSSSTGDGTPMAVLLDAEGRVASRVAAGSPAVLALLRGEAAA